MPKGLYREAVLENEVQPIFCPYLDPLNAFQEKSLIKFLCAKNSGSDSHQCVLWDSFCGGAVLLASGVIGRAEPRRPTADHLPAIVSAATFTLQFSAERVNNCRIAMVYIVLGPLLPNLLRGLELHQRYNGIVAILSMVHWKLSMVDFLFLCDVISHIRSLEEKVAGVGVVLQKFLKRSLRPEVSSSGAVAQLVQMLCDFIDSPAIVVEVENQTYQIRFFGLWYINAILDFVAQHSAVPWQAILEIGSDAPLLIFTG